VENFSRYYTQIWDYSTRGSSYVLPDHQEHMYQYPWNADIFNLLNAELNSICHLLVLLRNLTFMGQCIVNILQYISIKMQRYIVTQRHAAAGTNTNQWTTYYSTAQILAHNGKSFNST
jgi:hypothetical protein